MILGERVGPIAIDEVYDRLSRGEVDAQTMIWRKGMGEWQTIENTNDIDLSHLPPPLPTTEKQSTVDEETAEKAADKNDQ